MACFPFLQTVERRRALPCPVRLWMLRLIPDQPPAAAPAPQCHPFPPSTPVALARPRFQPQHVSIMILLYNLSDHLYLRHPLRYLDVQKLKNLNLKRNIKTQFILSFFISHLLPSDKWEPSFPTNPECCAISTAALQQRAVLLFFLFAG